MSIALLLSIVPVFLLAFYIYSKDSVKEPASLLLELFVSGFLAAIMVLLIDILIAELIPGFFVTDKIEGVSFFKLFSGILLQVALLEEFCKWLMIRFLGYNHRDFDQFYDIVVYSAFVSLGFALIENVLYVMPSGFSLGLFRATFSIPGHAAFGIFMGAFLALAKKYEKKDKTLSKIYMFYAVLVPALLHTIYNFCLLANKIWLLIVFAVFVVLLYLAAIIIVNVISKMKSQVN